MSERGDKMKDALKALRAANAASTSLVLRGNSRLHPGASVSPAGSPHATRTPTTQTNLVPASAIDLPRFCALHVMKPFISRYIRTAHGFAYAQSIRITDSMMRGQYDGREQGDLPPQFLGHEHCPWGGGYCDDWTGAIYCLDCNRSFCFCTVVRGYFMCPCGRGGHLASQPHPQIGFIPGFCGGGAAGRR